MLTLKQALLLRCCTLFKNAISTPSLHSALNTPLTVPYIKRLAMDYIQTNGIMNF